jgi:hypothetical protein
MESAGLTPTFVEGPFGPRKISDALLEFVQPVVDALRESERTKPRLEQILAVGALAWNAHLMPDGEACLEEALADMKLDLVASDVVRHVLEILLARRRDLFPDDRRFVINTVVTQKASGKFEVTAAHALSPVSA